MTVGGQRHAPASLPPGKRPYTQCTWGWVSPKAGLEERWESGLHRDSTPEPSSPDQNPNHTLRNNPACSHDSESLPENNYNISFHLTLKSHKAVTFKPSSLSDFKFVHTAHLDSVASDRHSIPDPDENQMIVRLSWLNKNRENTHCSK